MTTAALIIGLASLVCSVWLTLAARRMYRARRRQRLAAIFNPIASHVRRTERRR
jgi:hypothetical protein